MELRILCPHRIATKLKRPVLGFCFFPPKICPLFFFNFIKSILHQASLRTGLVDHLLRFIKSVCRIILWIPILLIFLPAFGFSQNNLEVPQLSIQTQSYLHNPDTGMYLYRNAKVEWEGITVESTEINYHPEKHRLTATGYVRVTEGSMVAVMDELEINVNDGKGIFRNAIIFDSSNNAYMTAEEVRRIGQNHYVAQTCTFTTCNPKSPAWQITGSEVNYYSQNFSSSQKTFLRIGNFPIFYFPYLAWPTVKHRQSGFLPPEYMIVRSSVKKWDIGYRFGIPYFWAIDQEQDLTLTYDWVERRGPGIRLDYQYALKEGMRGEIKYQEFFERDSRDPENESGSLNTEAIESSELNPKRFKFEFNHNQQLDRQSRLIVSSLVYSDSQFQKEYELIDNPDPNTAQKLSANINRQFSNGSVTLSATQTRIFSELALLNRKIDLTQIQQLPALSFQFSDTLWRSDKTSIFNEISGSLVRYYRVQGYNGEGAAATPRLKFNFPIFKHFNSNIKIGKQFSRYKVRDPNVSGSEDEYGFEILDGKIEINTTFSRIFTNETGIFSRFKHLLKPSIQYDYIEDIEQQSDSGVPFGGRVSTRRLTTIRLENVLLAKRRYFGERVTPFLNSQDRGQIREGKSSILASLNIIQHYDVLKKNPYFQPIGPAIKGNETESGLPSCSRSGCPLLPLRTMFNFTPGQGFSINYFNRYHHQKRQVVEYSTSMGFSASAHNKASVNIRKNEFTYQTPFGKDVSAAHTFGFSNKFATSDELALGFAGTMNLDADSTSFRRRLTSTTFTLDYRPDCWNIRLALTENVDKTTTSSGREQEYIDRTLYAYINLGGVDVPEQILPDLD